MENLSAELLSSLGGLIKNLPPDFAQALSRAPSGAARPVDIPLTAGKTKPPATDLSSIKSSLSFIEPKYRRIFKIIIKIVEINKLLEKFDEELREKIGCADSEQQRALLDLIKNSDKNQVEGINAILKVMNAREALRYASILANK
ncbi:MAG: hypothetical protein LBL35_03575 [Clostridiales bacterium]|jgi:hypothetical protein|nr:hypothetical protein [Clostridiales bacterium]